MVIVTCPSDLSRINHLAIWQLVSLRLDQLRSPDALDASDVPLTKFIVAEGGEAVAQIEQAAGFPILTSLFNDLPFDHPDFYPPFEIMEKHHYDNACFYEMVFISNDDGAATALLVPDQEEIAGDMLALCRSWATPAVSTP